jgi:hypothetical protein
MSYQPPRRGEFRTGLIATREICRRMGMPGTVPIKCSACGLRPGQTNQQIHTVLRYDEHTGLLNFYAFLCCRHVRAFNGTSCCRATR